MIDPDIVAAIDAGRVPENISAEYLNESTDRPTIVAIIFVTVFTSTIVVLRSFSRLFLVRRFGFDDALAVFGLVTLIAFLVLCIILINMGSGRHIEYVMYVLPMETVEETEIIDFAAHLIYTSSLLICRMSGLAFYYRLCHLHDKFLLAIKIVAGLLTAGYLLQMFLIIFHCIPVTGLWPYEWQTGFENYTCLQWGLVYCTNSAVSLVCDFFLFGIPIAMLKMLALSRKRRVQLAGILLPGILVVAISVTRLVLVVKGQWEPDMSWFYNPLLAVEVSEIGATLIALSIPGVKPLFDILLRRAPKEEKSENSNSENQLQTIGSLRPTKSMVASRNVGVNLDDVEHMGKEDAESTDGILVKVDFKFNEEYGRPQFDGKDQYKKS